jgi:hypothetical protein
VHAYSKKYAYFADCQYIVCYSADPKYNPHQSRTSHTLARPVSRVATPAPVVVTSQYKIYFPALDAVFSEISPRLVTDFASKSVRPATTYATSN